VKAWL